MEKEFNFNKFWGSPLIAPHVVFRRNSTMYCVYCGSQADTREHCPPKAFLKKPHPTNLPTVPACKNCNNGFSSDERYASSVINCLVEYYQKGNLNACELNFDDINEVRDAKQSVEKFIRKPYFDDRIANIFRKMAICHAAFEISSGYYSQEWVGRPERISYTIKPFLKLQEWEDLEYAEVINNEPLPEIGSRAFRNIYVVQAEMKSVKANEYAMLPMVMVDWEDVQDDYYKYQVYFKDNKIWVKMIFREFLYCEVVFSKTVA